MSGQKRITVDDVLAAYKATGLKPARGSVWNEGRQTCAIGALCTQATGRRTGAYDWANRTFGCVYVADFICGFDFDGGRKLRSRGFCDGRAAAAAVFALPSADPGEGGR